MKISSHSHTRYFGNVSGISEENHLETIALLVNKDDVIIGSVSASKVEECAEIFVNEDYARRMYIIRPDSLEILIRGYDKLRDGVDEKKRFPRKEDWIKQPEKREFYRGNYSSQIITVKDALQLTRKNPEKISLCLPGLP